MGTSETEAGAKSPPFSQSSEANVSDKKPDHTLAENSKQNLDEKLDHGVEETFPGSDPVSVKITK